MLTAYDFNIVKHNSDTEKHRFQKLITRKMLYYIYCIKYNETIYYGRYCHNNIRIIWAISPFKSTTLSLNIDFFSNYATTN